MSAETYSYCESGNRGTWHIRRVGPEGLKLGGGLNVLEEHPGLCGYSLARWDINSPGVSRSHIGAHGFCQKCLEIWKEEAA